MADIVYTVNQDSPENIAGFEQYSQEDKALVSSFQINSVFDPTKNYSELHILSLSDELLESTYSYRGFSELGNAQSAGQAGVSVLTIDPIADSKAYGYGGGGVKLLYHFLDDLYSTDGTLQEFFIQDISQDRTELVLSTLNLTPEQLTATTSAIKTKLQSQSYFTGFRLNFKNNDLFIATNIDTLDIGTEKVVVVKLYEPLPTTYNLKSTLNIVDVVSDSVAYEIDAEYILPPEIAPTLRSPNFDLDVTDNNVVPTGYYNYNELFSYPVNNTNSQIFSTVNEKGIDISVDYTTFSDFVHFSSAQERLLNFKYKLDLVASYSASLATIANSTTGLQGVSGSRDYYQNLLTGVVSNFDHYERFLYYESGSSSWPKSNTTKPYINKASTNSEAIAWYTNQIANAIKYDQTNYNSLAYSIPTYLRDDANNENYLTFVYMVGQHFDNLWLYSKAVTDKYDADNRIDKGISKDLVAEALKNFGVKLYTSNKSVEDLFTTFVGQPYQSGSEKINFYITGSLTGSNTPIQPTAYDDYQKEIQKRIYHNLPLLLKSKGTERGLRALINCFGIPADILKIKLYGGRNTNERPFYGDYQNYTSSLNKIRLDNTGSLVSGSTLSNSVSIIKRDDKYTDDVHVIEVGFSPSDNIDSYIVSRSLATASLSNFNIDNYLGDPSNIYLDNYSGLENITATVVSGSAGVSGSYDLRDYVKLIKFFDNTVFKMVKDFIPARAVADTGIIIKPHLLNRSKAKSAILSATKVDYTGSIDTAFISGKNPNTFRFTSAEASLQYEDLVQTPTGFQRATPHLAGEAGYNGEISSSRMVLSKTDLNSSNPYKVDSYTVKPFSVQFVSSSNEICLLGAAQSTTPFYITSSQALFSANQFFTGINSNCVYSASSTNSTTTLVQTTFPRTFGPATQPSPGYFLDFYIRAVNKDVTVPSPGSCKQDIQVRFATCSIGVSATGLTQNTVQQYDTISQQPTYPIASWFTNPNSQTVTYIASVNGIETAIPAADINSYKFTQPQGSTVTIIMKDPNIGNICTVGRSVFVGGCYLSHIPLDPTVGEETIHGFQFRYSKDFTGIENQPDTLLGNPYNTTDFSHYVDHITSQSILNVNNQYQGGGSYTYGVYRNIYQLSKVDLNNQGIFQGIQGYFRYRNLLNPQFIQDSTIRYNIYKLYNKSSTNVTNKYTLETIAKNLDPSQPPSSWGSNVGGPDKDILNPVLQLTQLGVDYLYYNSTGTSLPIILNTPASTWTPNWPNGQNSQLLTTVADLDPKTLPQAYYIEAYKANSPSCIESVTIYGDRGTLGTALTSLSGYGAFPQYQTIDILADWDYGNQNPPTVIPPTLPPGYVGQGWKSIKIRLYGTYAIGAPNV